MSQNLEIIGNVYHVGDKETNDAGYSKRECVVHIPDSMNPKWDDYIRIEFKGDNCDKLDAFGFDDEVKIQTNIRGIKYERKDGSGTGYFNNIEGWKIETVQTATPPSEIPENNANQPPLPQEETNNEPTDDLPF